MVNDRSYYSHNNCSSCNLYPTVQMNNYRYNSTTSVKPLLKFIKWEQLKRSNWLVGESNTFFVGDSTWNSYKRKKVKSNYIKRIEKGEVEIFYLDLIEHTIKEFKDEIDRHWVLPTSAGVDYLNKYNRLVLYYEAILELNINYRST